MSDTIVLNRLFDMSLSGRYRITASRKLLKGGSKTEVVTLTSNMLEMDIETKVENSWVD